MKNPINLLEPRTGFILLGLAAFGLVAASLILTKALDLSPCPLCVFQRMLYLLLGTLALAGALCARARPWAGWLALMTGLGGLVTALHQSWMQAYPASAIACGVADPSPIELLVEWAGERMPALFFAWGECTSREWELFGLSIANWSAVSFLAISLALMTLMRRHMIVSAR